MMKTKILLLLLAVLFVGCSSKRKITDFKTHEVHVVQEVEEIVSDSTKLSQKDSSKTNTNTKETWKEAIKETTTYDSSGNKVSTVIETNRSGEKFTNLEETKRSESDSTNVKQTVLETVIDSIVSKVDKRNEAIPEKPRNPIWHYIGVGLFVIIVGGAVVAYFRLRQK